MAVDGDLRFVSHHDCMRAVERVVARARLPVTFTQGFNPHPVMSLPVPRPVAVATDDDLVVLKLDEDLPADTLADRLNAAAPSGMVFREAQPLAAADRARPTHVSYRTDLDDPGTVAQRIDDLTDRTDWPVQRMVSTKSRRKGRVARTIDLKPMVDHLRVRGGHLEFTLVPSGDMWARPGELLGLLGLDPRTGLAGTRRRNVRYEFEQTRGVDGGLAAAGDPVTQNNGE